MDLLPLDLAAVLSRLSGELKALYGDRYQGLLLYGSYARGEAHEGSDVDLLLLLEGPVDPVQEILRMEPAKWPISLESGYVLSILPTSIDDYRKAEDPLLWNASREGMPAA
jgi:predicted nucleotidyltransferase